MNDNFDKLAKGKRMTSRKRGRLIDGDWVEARLRFDTNKLEYYVELRWGGDGTKSTYEKQYRARSEWKELCEKHNLKEI